MGRLMAGATAGNQRNLIGFLFSADQYVEVRQFLQLLRMCLGDALQHFQLNVFDLVDELFHGAFLLEL